MGFSALIGLASRVPWQVWLVIACLMTNPISYCKGKSDGKQVILERLEKAQERAKKEAKAASDIADKNQAEGDAKDNAELDALKKEIEDAKEAGGNPLDAIFSSVPND